MSIGYATKESALDQKTGVRKLKELELWEVSLVTFPMNEMAGITARQGGAGQRARIRGIPARGRVPPRRREDHHRRRVQGTGRSAGGWGRASAYRTH